MNSAVSPREANFWARLSLKCAQAFNSLLSEFKSKSRFSIDSIDERRQQVGIVECGMTFYLHFRELHKHLSLVNDMTKLDVVLFAFLIARYDTNAQIDFSALKDNHIDANAMLEGEDRYGRFKIFDFTQNSLLTLNFLELLQNNNILKRMDVKALYQIGMSAGYRKIKTESLKHLFSIELLQ